MPKELTEEQGEELETKVVACFEELVVWYLLMKNWINCRQGNRNIGQSERLRLNSEVN